MGEIKKVPQHVSIIMDGNGRWAKERGEERLRGHFEGVESIRACTEECINQGVRYLSLFAFSEENWKRSEAEVSGLMKLIFRSMEEEIGVFMGQSVRMSGKGEPGSNGGPNGDLYITVMVQPDSVFSREGYDIYLLCIIELSIAF